MISACTKEIKMDIPDNERKLVVNGIFNVGEPIVLTVSKSKSMLEKSQIESVDNAEIKLFENGAFLTNLDTVSRLWYFNYLYDQFDPYNYTMENIYRTTYYSKGRVIATDRNYKIEVTASGIDLKAYVEMKIPSLVPIVKIDTATIKTDQYNVMLQFDMLIKDPPDEENFYMINLYMKVPMWDPKDPYYPGNGLNSASIESDDIIIKNTDANIENGLIFTDNLFNGKLQNIKFKTAPFWGDTTYYQVHLSSISEDYYNYLVSSGLFSSNDGNPIAEPVSVKSNVKDGFGIVTAVNQWIDSSIVYIKPWIDYPGKIK
jgi:hypothetical protein